MGKQKILLTGATGLLGSHIIEDLREKFEIHCIVREMPDLSSEDVFFYKINLSDNFDLFELPTKFDIILHLSQSNEFRNFPDKALDIFDVNVSSTLRLLDFAQKTNVKKFILASSGGVYGSGVDPFNEQKIINVNNNLGFYLGSKMCGEILAKNYSNIFDVIVMRFFFMYGQKQKRTMLMPRLVDNVKNGIPIVLSGLNGISINPIHVSDASKAVKKSLELSGSYTFNIAGDEVVTIRDIAELISVNINKKVIFANNDEASRNLIGDNKLMRELLHVPAVSLETGIRELIDVP